MSGNFEKTLIGSQKINDFLLDISGIMSHGDIFLTA